MGEDAESVQGSMTLEGYANRITVPLLQVKRVAAEARGPTTTVVNDGVHVANNVSYRSRPLVADWLAEVL